MVCINEKEVRGYLFPKNTIGNRHGLIAMGWNMRGGIHVFSDPALIPTGSDERGVLEGRENFCCNTSLLSVSEKYCVMIA